MEEILKLDTVKKYNDLLGVETIHPLVSVINASEIAPLRHVRKNIGFYVIYLKDIKCSDLLKYGRKFYDYQEETLVFAAQGQIVGNNDTGEYFQPKGWWLTFHPDLLHGTPLGKRMKEYSFFSYATNEALHISKKERQLVIECLTQIDEEIRKSSDKHSNLIITSTIKLLLDYCTRFYDRQFNTRKEENKDKLGRFEELLNDYFDSDKPKESGIPTVKYFADELCLSSNYFGDLIKKETGKSAQEYIQSNIIDRAKELLSASTKSVSEIAYELGYQYPQYFNRFFKNAVGCTPNEYRKTEN